MLSNSETSFSETYEYALRFALLQQNIAREVYKAGQDTYKEKFQTTETPLPATFLSNLCAVLERGTNVSATPNAHPLEPSQVAGRCYGNLAKALRNRKPAESFTLEQLVQLYVDYVLYDFQNNGLTPSLQVKARLIKCIDEFLLVTLPLARGNTELMNRFGSYKLILLHLEQDQYVEFVGEIFNMDPQEHQENIRLLRPSCTRQVAILELQSLQANLAQGKAAYVPEAFKSEHDFHRWLLMEKEKVGQLLNGLQSIPCLSSDQYEKAQLTPNDARKHFKNLLLLILPEERWKKKFCDVGSVFLNICAHHWRIPSFFRQVAQFKAANIKWEMGELSYDALSRAIMEIETLPEDAIHPDIQEFLFICDSLENLLVERFGETLQLLDGNPQEEFGWIKVIINSIKDNQIVTSYREGSGPFAQQIEGCIQYSALERYKDLQSRISNDDQDSNEAQNLLEITRVMLEDIAKCRTMFPFNEFRTQNSPGINVITTLLKPQLGYFTLDIQNMVDDRNSQYIALRDTFELYSNVYRLSDIAKLHGLEFQFNLTRWFQSQIDRWLGDLDTKAHDWVQRAIEKDQLHFVSEKLRHSSSIVDLFSFFQQQLNPGFELQWPSPQMKAMFVRDLSKIIMKRIQLYCQIIREKFREQIENQRNEITRNTVNVSKYSWSSLLRRSNMSESASNEFQVLREYCVILNNLAQAENSLFKLWTALDYDPGQDEVRTTNMLQTPASLTYMMTVVQARNLQACDFNGLSDPFVILRVGHRDVGQTTVMSETLNPWWEESFQFDVEGTEELCITVYDKDYMNDDLCGIGLPLKLDPKVYTEYTIREDWITLVPHGRVLIRSMAFGETEDVEFYFGKGLNIASMTLKDLARLLVYQMHQDLSNHVYEIFTHFQGKAATSVTTELCDRALHPLLNYLDNNLGNLYENLYDKSWNAVVKELWDDLLDIYENIIFPPLGTNRNPLSETELRAVFRCLELTKVFFHGGSTESGVNIKELENERYQQLLLTEKLFHMSSEELIECFRAHTNQLYTDRTNQEYKEPEKAIFLMIYHILRVLQMVHKEFNEKFVMKQMEMIAFPSTQN